MSLRSHSGSTPHRVREGERLAVAGGPPRPPSARYARTGEVLDLIRREVATTTTELAASMGVARSTVTERLDLLMRHGLVVAAGETAPSRGRPASILRFNERAGLTLTAQVGMSGTFIAVTDLAGEVLWINQVHLDVRAGRQALCDMLAEQFTTALAELGDDAGQVHGIGIGLPGDIEIATAHGGQWDQGAIIRQLSDAFACPTFVDRDVNFLALGEHRATWPDSRTMLCIKVGTVIACGLVIDGAVVRGVSGLFGEIGHTKVPGNDLPCTCGSRGCLNTVAGGTAIADRLRELGHDTRTTRDVTALANRGVTAAGQEVREAGNRIGEVVASAINLLNPDVVTVWGYLVDAGDQFLAGMHEAVYRNALPSSARALTLERSRLGDDAGVRGAALTVIEQTLEPVAVDRYFADAAAGARSPAGAT